MILKHKVSLMILGGNAQIHNSIVSFQDRIQFSEAPLTACLRVGVVSRDKESSNSVLFSESFDIDNIAVIIHSKTCRIECPLVVTRARGVPKTGLDHPANALGCRSWSFSNFVDIYIVQPTIHFVMNKRDLRRGKFPRTSAYWSLENDSVAAN